MTTPILKVQELTTQFQIRSTIATIIDKLSFNLYPGKTLALVGESGCGKSITALTLLRMLPSLALPATGHVFYQEKNLLTLTEKEMRKIRGAKIGIIFQNPMTALNPVYTIGEQLIEVAETHFDVSALEAEEKAEAALKSVGFDHPKAALFTYPHQLSGGMRQRVMIAMAIICEPDILIADEPTTALDVTIQSQILSLFKQLQQEKGLAILLITHDMGVVSELADEVLVMYASQIVEQSDKRTLFQNPCHPYTIGLFQSLPSLEGKKKPLIAIKGQVPDFLHFPTGCKFHPRCPSKMKKCEWGPVENFQIEKEDNHQVKCWLYEKFSP